MLMVCAGCIVAVLMIVAFFIEKKVTGYYKAAKIYGRVYAYFAVNFLVAGVFGLMMIGEMLLHDSKEFVRDASQIIVVYGIVSVLVLLAGIYMYWHIYHKSPDFLKKRCLLDLTITGMAVACRLGLWFMCFFVKTWWTVAMPETYTLSDSRQEVYVFPDGMVYDPSSGKFGKADAGREQVVWDVK